MGFKFDDFHFCIFLWLLIIMILQITIILNKFSPERTYHSMNSLRNRLKILIKTEHEFKQFFSK